MQTWHNWSLFEKILCLSSTVILLATGLIFQSSWPVFIASLAGVWTTFLIAKGKVSGQVIGLVTISLYIFTSWQQQYYGEVLIYALVMLPLRLWSIFTWSTHQNKKEKTIKIYRLAKKDWQTLAWLFCLALFDTYFLLKAFNTNQLASSTFAAVTGVFAIYLLAKRSKQGFSFFIANDLIRISLWLSPVIHGDWSVLPMALSCLIFLINDSYGLYNWTKLEKKQHLAQN